MHLVVLYGPAASGKLTVARELSRSTGLPVFHNHLVVNALLEVFEFDSPEFVRLRERFWLDTFEAAAQSGRSVVFTFTPESTVSGGFLEGAAAVVTGLGGRTCLVLDTETVSPSEAAEAIRTTFSVNDETHRRGYPLL